MSYLRFTKTAIIVLAVVSILAACNSSSESPPSPTPTPYTVVLVCDDCAALGMDINIWQNAGTSRGSVAFSVPHNTTVNVLDSKIADDGRRWYNVEYNGNDGWVAQDFVK